MHVARESVNMRRFNERSLRVQSLLRVLDLDFRQERTWLNKVVRTELFSGPGKSQ